MRFLHTTGRTLLFLQLMLSVACHCQAQKAMTDSLLPLKQVDVSATRLDQFGVGKKVIVIDSSAMATLRSLNLSDLLSSLTLVAVKSYGAGSLATISMRGTGAAHSAVLWNGFSLQSPLNGGTDVSLIPVLFADKVTVQYGGAGALVGSGALGGTIQFESKPVFDRTWNINAAGTAGSFDDYSGQVAARISGAKLASSTRFFYASSKNNYPFRNITLPGKPLVDLSHAGVLGYGLMHENFLKVAGNHQINLLIWCQNEQREIPPLMTRHVSKATQADRFARVNAEWKHQGIKMDLTARSAYSYEWQHYADPDIRTDALLTSSVSSTEFEGVFRIRKGHVFSAGVNVTYALATSDNYDETARQWHESVFVSWKTISKDARFKTVVSLREAVVDRSFLNPVPSAGLEWNIFKLLGFYVNGSAIYRLPTLNDRYWVPGGNPGLKPEQGWTEEAGIRITAPFNNLKTEFTVSGFNSNINNWIIWLPKDSYWSPRNLLVVWSRGAEAGINTAFQKKSWLIKVNLTANYVRSTNQKSKYQNDAAVGKQIIYVPLISAVGTVEINWRLYQMFYVHSYAGKRFTTSDNSYFVEPYHTARLNVSKRFSLPRLTIDVFGSVNNLWNESYQAIAWMPASGRSFKAGVVFGISGKIKKPNLKS